MRTALLFLVCTGTLLATGAGVSAAPRTAAQDVRLLGSTLEEVHPNPFRHVSRARFRAAVARLARQAPRLSANELLVGLMRLAALPGPRNGHTGLFPLVESHRRELHLYPLRLYHFHDGLFVVAETGQDGLVGSRLEAIAGRPVEELLRLVHPLVPRDNVWSRRGWAPHYLLVAELLDGLGVTGGVGPRELTLVRRDGQRVRVTLSPLGAAEYLAAFRDPLHGHYPSLLPAAPRPLFLSQGGRPLWLRTLDRGRAVYVGYNSALATNVDPVAARLERLAGDRRVRRIVVDVRLNGGGDNTSYGPLLNVLAREPVNRRGRLYLLIGRATFSAAGNFAAEVDRYTQAILVGEPTGGGIDQYGDSTAITLPTSGWTVYVATERVVRGARSPRDRRLAVEPDIRVDLTSADYFAGRDPVLAHVLDRR